MNKIVYKIAVFIISSMIMISCGEEQTFFKSVGSIPDGARIKFIHAASDTTGANFFLSGQKISSGTTVGTATAPSVVAYPIPFPAVDYSTVTSGSYTLQVIVPDKLDGTTQYVQKTMVSSDLSLDAEKYYTIAFAGVTGAYQAVVLEDATGSIPFDGQSYIRFVNLIHNSTNKVNVVATPLSGDLTPINIATNVGYKEVVEFTGQIPRNYTIRLLDAVTPATVLATASAANGTLIGNRVYTLFARGRIGAGGTGAPVLDRMVNR